MVRRFPGAGAGRGCLLTCGFMRAVQPGYLRSNLLYTLVSANVSLVLDALEVAAEPNRRRLLHLLAGQEQTVGELAAHFTVSRSAVSQHLLLLEQARPGVCPQRRAQQVLQA